jgi:hypothetical protein
VEELYICIYPRYGVLCRKSLQLLEHIALDMPSEVPTKRLLPAVLKAVSSQDMEVREAALSLLIRLARRAEVLSELQKVTPSSPPLPPPN